MADCMTVKDFIIWLNQNSAKAAIYQGLQTDEERAAFLLAVGVCPDAIKKLKDPKKAKKVYETEKARFIIF